MNKTRSMSRKNILVVVAEMGHNSQREIAGITRYAKRAGLSVDVVESRHFGERPDFAKWIEFWNPGGLIVDPGFAAEALADEAASKLPIVVWDAAEAGDNLGRCAMVLSDPVAIAEAAARELMETRFRRFAFVPALRNPLWSRERAETFTAALSQWGHHVSIFIPEAGNEDRSSRFRKGLLRFLETLEKPCGIFAANDPTAAIVAKSCAELGLRIPQDIALLGVDDSAEYCEHLEPTLTSIRVDLESGGAMAAKLMADLMSEGRLASAGDVAHYGVERIVRRESTRVLSVFDRRVSRALEWIRHNACSPIGAADVVAVMGCSRRMADLSFRRATGHTILDEIHARRLDEVLSILKRDDVPIEEIPTRCGYDRGPYLGILFKRHFGCSMRQWRKDWIHSHAGIAKSVVL